MIDYQGGYPYLPYIGVSLPSFSNSLNPLPCTIRLASSTNADHSDAYTKTKNKGLICPSYLSVLLQRIEKPPSGEGSGSSSVSAHSGIAGVQDLCHRGI